MTSWSGSGPTWKSPRAWGVLLVVLAVGLVADLWSKQLAFDRVAGRPVVITRAEVMATDALGTLIPRHDPVVVVPSVLEFTLVLNPGAVFGLGAGKRVLFIGFTIVAIVLGVAMFAGWTRSRDWIAHASIGLLLAGGLGNLYDRLTFACVRDFIHPLPGVTVAGREIWPYVSNVADALLIFGIIGLMVYLWTSDHHQTPREDLDKGDSGDAGASKHESDGSAGTRRAV